MTIERVEILEHRVRGIDSTLDRIDGKIDGLSLAMQSLVRIEERQVSNKEKLEEYADSITMLRHDIEQKAHHRDDRIRNIELALPENLSKRLNTVESHMPGLLEIKKWVSGGVLMVIAIVGTAAVHQVLK